MILKIREIFLTYSQTFKINFCSLEIFWVQLGKNCVSPAPVTSSCVFSEPPEHCERGFVGGLSMNEEKHSSLWVQQSAVLGSASL